MKLATRAAGRGRGQDPQGRLMQTLKRLTWQERPGPVRDVVHLQAEADRAGIGEDEFRAFGVLWDLQDDKHRYFPAVRYLNAANGVVKQTAVRTGAQGHRRGLVRQRGDVDHRGPEVVGAPSPASILGGSAVDTPTGAPRASGRPRRRGSGSATTRRSTRSTGTISAWWTRAARVREPSATSGRSTCGASSPRSRRPTRGSGACSTSPSGWRRTRTAAASCSWTRRSSRRGRVRGGVTRRTRARR